MHVYSRANTFFAACTCLLLLYACNDRAAAPLIPASEDVQAERNPSVGHQRARQEAEPEITTPQLAPVVEQLKPESLVFSEPLPDSTRATRQTQSHQSSRNVSIEKLKAAMSTSIEKLKAAMPTEDNDAELHLVTLPMLSSKKLKKAIFDRVEKRLLVNLTSTSLTKMHTSCDFSDVYSDQAKLCASGACRAASFAGSNRRHQWYRFGWSTYGSDDFYEEGIGVAIVESNTRKALIMYCRWEGFDR